MWRCDYDAAGSTAWEPASTLHHAAPKLPGTHLLCSPVLLLLACLHLCSDWLRLQCASECLSYLVWWQLITYPSPPSLTPSLSSLPHSLRQVDSQYTNKDFFGAQRSSKLARNWSIGGILTGLVTVLIYLIVK